MRSHAATRELCTKFGLFFANAGPFSVPETFEALVRSADEVGIESLWAVGHVVVPVGYGSQYPYSKDGRMPGGEKAPIPDPIVSLAYAAAISKRVRLATGIVILPQRHPAYVAKEFASLDVLSRGRAILGIGIGWLAEEFAVIGGPIVVGGHVEGAARRAARIGDGFFPAKGGFNELPGLLDAMRDECKKLGRKPETIEITTAGANLDADTVKRHEDLGVSRLVIGPPAFDPEGLRRGLGEFAERFIARSPARTPGL